MSKNVIYVVNVILTMTSNVQPMALFFTDVHGSWAGLMLTFLLKKHKNVR